jgi:hypothetical protein
VDIAPNGHRWSTPSSETRGTLPTFDPPDEESIKCTGPMTEVSPFPPDHYLHDLEQGRQTSKLTALNAGYEGSGLRVGEVGVSNELGVTRHFRNDRA